MRGVAKIGGAQLSASMTACVQEDSDHAVLSPHDYDRIATERAGDVIAGCGNLGLMGQKLPSSTEYPLALVVEDGVIEERPAADRRPVFTYQGHCDLFSVE
jgi:hypothetical protein